MKMKRLWIIISALFLILCSCTGCQNPNAGENIPQRYIEAIKLVKNDLKDPTSMRIYGDIVVLKIDESNLMVISVIYDAKNGYGAYTGKSTAEIVLSPEADPAYVTDDSDQFNDIRAMAESYENMIDSEKEQFEAAGGSKMEVEVLSGETIASLLDVEFYAS